MRLKLTKITISEYLRAKTKGTAENYLIYLNKYFQLIYPELAPEWKTLRRKKDQQQPYWDKLDALSLEYLASDRDLRKDLLDYKEAIKDYAPKTRGVQLSAVIGFLDDNGIQIPSRLKKDLFGRNKSAVVIESTGKHMGKFLGIQGTGKAFRITAVHLFKAENGLTKHWRPVWNADHLKNILTDA